MHFYNVSVVCQTVVIRLGVKSFSRELLVQYLCPDSASSFSFLLHLKLNQAFSCCAGLILVEKSATLIEKNFQFICMQLVNVRSPGHINFSCTSYFCVYLLSHIIARCWRDSSLCVFKMHVNASRKKKNVYSSCNGRDFFFSASLMLGENKNNF